LCDAGQSWHVGCFTCHECKKGLDSTTLVDKDNEIFCRACHGKLYGPKVHLLGRYDDLMSIRPVMLLVVRYLSGIDLRASVMVSELAHWSTPE